MLTVNVHVRADTTVEVTTYPDEGRATVAFEGYRHATDVTLFLHTAELRELRDLLDRHPHHPFRPPPTPLLIPPVPTTETTDRAA